MILKALNQATTLRYAGSRGAMERDTRAVTGRRTISDRALESWETRLIVLCTVRGRSMKRGNSIMCTTLLVNFWYYTSLTGEIPPHNESSPLLRLRNMSAYELNNLV